MAALIFELSKKGLHQYHAIDKPIVRIGRAFDNDIILSDPTVSPHHAIIESSNGDVVLRNLSHENPLQVDGKLVEESISIERFPCHLEIGRLQTRVMPTDTQVAPTRHVGCQSFSRCLIQNPLSATFLFLAVLILSVLTYLSGLLIPIKWADLLQETGSIALGIILIAVIIASLTRASTHRWQIAPAIAIVSLLFLISEITGIAAHSASYFFSKPVIINITDIILNIVITPLIFWLFLTRIAHTSKLAANIVALVLIVPLVYGTFTLHANDFGYSNTFSKRANYDNTLLIRDYRLSPTISIDSFINSSKKLEAGKVIKP